jgi:hypothetical protein
MTVAALLPELQWVRVVFVFQHALNRVGGIAPITRLFKKLVEVVCSSG